MPVNVQRFFAKETSPGSFSLDRERRDLGRAEAIPGPVAAGLRYVRAMTERGPVLPAGTEKSYEQFHFAPAYRVGDTLYVSGVIGTGDEMADEFTNAFENLNATLEAAGFALDDIVDMTSFHIDMDKTLGAFMAARDAVMSEPWPAWTAIGCSALAIPGGRAEVKVTAVKQ